MPWCSLPTISPLCVGFIPPLHLLPAGNGGLDRLVVEILVALLPFRLGGGPAALTAYLDGIDLLLELLRRGRLALPCGLLLHAVVRAFRPGDRRLLLLLTLFGGIFGMHRFYAGRPLSGLYMLMLTPLGLILLVGIIGVFPLSAVTIWVLADLVFVASGRFRDGQGRRITGRQDEGRDESNSRSRRRLVLLTIFLGVVGAHRFLVRRPYTGLCMLCLFVVNVYYLQCIPLMREATDFIWLLLTFPLQLSWLLSDIAAVSCGCFRDGRGRPATA